MDRVQMTIAEISNLFVQIVCLLVLPIGWSIFRSIRSLELGQVDLKKELEKNDERIAHITNNYRQGIEHLNQEVQRVCNDICEMKADIKELLKKK